MEEQREKTSKNKRAILSPPTHPKKKERTDRKKTQRTQCRGGAIEIQAPVGRGRASVGPAAVQVVRERVSRRGRGGGGLGLGVRRGLLLLVLLMLMLGGGGIGPGHRRQRHRGGRRIRCGRIRRRRHRRGPSAPHAAASDAPTGPRAHGGQHAVAPERRHGAVGQGEGRGERGRDQRRIQGRQVLARGQEIALVLTVVGAAVVLLHRSRTDRGGHASREEARVRKRSFFFRKDSERNSVSRTSSFSRPRPLFCPLLPLASSSSAGPANAGREPSESRSRERARARVCERNRHRVIINLQFHRLFF